MNIDIIVEARVDSKRFPKKKVIQKINKKFIIEIMIERLKIKNFRYIILATTKKKSDDILIKIAKKNKIKFFRGHSKMF